MYKSKFKSVVTILTILMAFSILYVVARDLIPDKNRELFSMLSVLILRETLSKSMRDMFPETKPDQKKDGNGSGS